MVCIASGAKALPRCGAIGVAKRHSNIKWRTRESVMKFRMGALSTLMLMGMISAAMADDTPKK